MEEKMKPIVSKLLLLSFVLSQIAVGQSPSQTRADRVENGLLPAVLVKGNRPWTLQERMKHYKVPGVSIAVIKDYKVEWAKGYGVRDSETNEPVTSETLFQAGSISKSVNAMIALKKVEQGKISLEENINDKLTSWKLPDNEFTAKHKVTLANLLSHTGGLTVHGFPGYAPGEPLPTLPQVLDGASPANTPAVRVNMEPGTKYRYSGGGITIAQLAIMDIEKKPYPQIARETVLGPLGMASSTYEQPLPPEIRKKTASGYRPDGNVVDGKIHVYPEMAAAGLWTTPTDLAKFAIEVQLSLQGKSNKVLSKDTATKMVTPFIEDFVGFGFFLQKRGNAIYFGHDGADEGFRAQLLVNRDKGYGAAVMVNSDNGQIMDEIFRSIAKEYGWDDFLPAPLEVVSVEATQLDQYAGRFQVNPDRVINITREGKQLFMQPTQAPRVEMLAISDTEFIRKDVPIRYNFVRGENGKFDTIKIVFDGGGGQANRLANDRLIPFEQVMAGKFAEAIEAYKKIKREQPNADAVAEERINTLGYGLLQRKKTNEAIAIFKANVEMYPQSSNAYDSLGEAYMANGDKEQAIANYKKSLELNPKNDNAVKMLKKLSGNQH
jgi:CubicO group peptidase (beta-lactamase class C family)